MSLYDYLSEALCFNLKLDYGDKIMQQEAVSVKHL